MNVWDIIFTTEFGYMIFRVTTPILFTALGAMISRRAGIMNISLEGLMLVGALFGVIGSAYSQSVVAGVLSAVAASLVMSLLFAYFVLKLKSDLILTGIALNLMASGGTVFLLSVLCGDKGVSTSMNSLVVPAVELPLIRHIPVLGPILSGHNLLTYAALLCVALVYLLINKSPLGLRIRSVGENPSAAESVGISVVKTRFTALVFTGILSGLGGAYMSMGYVSWFARDMAAGRGYMALAGQNLGNATPIGTFLSSFLFGIADAMSSSLQVLSVPAEFIQMLPYVTTIIGLILFAVNRKRKSAKARMKL